jgi:uncharacterized protein
MNSQLPTREEVFAIPRQDGQFYLYWPVRRSAAVVNAAMVDAVATYLQRGEDALLPAQRAAVKSLRESGILDGEAPPLPVFPSDYVFSPHQVTLFPTSRCNLRCRYCYADAGRKSVDMPWEVAQAAIDLVSTEAGLRGLPKFGVGFHGGGECTMAWAMMVRCAEYAKARGEQMGLEAELFAATNGLLSDEQLEYIVRHFSTVNISLDGPADVQNFNRPKANHQGSFDEVVRSMRYFDQRDFFYGIRSTITARSVERMPEIVEWLGAEFKLKYLHMEPAWLCGRCLTTGEQPPADDVFARCFLASIEAGRRVGIDVHYSGARLDVLTSKFCAAPGDGFTVLPEGIVTSCYEVTEPEDPRAAIFHYGRYDAASGKLVFDQARIAALQKLSVENLPFCHDCFCKWHCAGDCLAKVFARSGSTEHCGSSRCQLNRSLTLAQLEHLVHPEMARAGEKGVTVP